MEHPIVLDVSTAGFAASDMNRKERRAALRGDGRLASARAASTLLHGASIDASFAAALKHHRAGELAEAQQICRGILTREPRHVPSLVLVGSVAQQAGRNQAAIKILREALEIDDRGASVHDAIAMAYQAAGRREDAVRHFTQAITRGLDNIERIIKQSPAVGACLDRLRNAWPRRLTLAELLKSDSLDTIANEALLVALLRSRPVCDIELERLFTTLRLALLQVANADASPDISDAAFDLCCALAQQCFINEYLFAASEAELEQAQVLRDRVAALIDGGAEVAPFQAIVVGTYFALHTLNVPPKCRDWPAAMDSLVTQQIHQPQAEAHDRATIPSLTCIEDGTSVEVQKQYEENPYPRWTAAPPVTPTTLADYLRQELPFAPLRPLGDARAFDMLIAGCGTGAHSIERALRLPQARVLAVDLSRASLAYARRKTLEAGLTNLEYAQADILALGSIGRTFDVIESLGVLHHMDDPLTGWRSLLSVLRPNGLMAIGLYSAVARRVYTAMRAAIAERGFHATAEDIRAFRQDLISRGEARETIDFFSTSGCRDLMFNVMEHQFTIPQIKAFVVENKLIFLGFELAPDIARQFRQIHPDPTTLVDLDRWDAFELSHPQTFAAMYVFWVQKAQD